MTKTLNPLHFEDLEPHRFEDLVRQIVYDFKEWSLLEPTGRLGSDDGYDARGFEIVKSGIDIDADEPAEDDEDDSGVAERQERLWQIQCKREQSISPSKITKYVGEMIPKGSAVPYGVIFAAATDFSKKTRDVFREQLREKGVRNSICGGMPIWRTCYINRKRLSFIRLFRYFAPNTKTLPEKQTPGAFGD